MRDKRRAVLYPWAISIAMMEDGYKWDDKDVWKVVAEKTGVPMKTLERVKKCKWVRYSIAHKIADALNLEDDEAFKYVD